MDDFYSVLGVPPNASLAQIKQRYRFLAQAYHPDKFASDAHKRDAEEAFKGINEAFQALSDPSLRADYDRQRVSGSSGPPKSSPPPPARKPKPTQPRARRLFNLSPRGVVYLTLPILILVAALLNWPEPAKPRSMPQTDDWGGIRVPEPSAPPPPTSPYDALFDAPAAQPKSAPASKYDVLLEPAAQPVEQQQTEGMPPEQMSIGQAPGSPGTTQPTSIPFPKFATEEEAEREAVRRYPELGDTGTLLNQQFVARARFYRVQRPDYFSDPSWPL